MRHFLTVALAPAGLPPGMMEAAPQRLLVVCARPSNALAPRQARARIGTLPLPVIAAPAHPQLLLTARTVQQAVAGNDNWPTSSPHQAWAATRRTTRGPHRLRIPFSAMGDAVRKRGWPVPALRSKMAVRSRRRASASRPTPRSSRSAGPRSGGSLVKRERLTFASDLGESLTQISSDKERERNHEKSKSDGGGVRHAAGGGGTTSVPSAAACDWSFPN